MANAKALSMCPNCETETEPKASTCTVCGFILNAPDNKYFAVPDYLSYQFEDKIKEATVSEKSTEVRKTEALSKDIRAHYVLFWQNCTDDVRLACMKDAMKCMRALLNSRASIDSVKQINAIGKDIGQLSTAIEEYFRSGGQYNGSKLPEPTAPAPGEESQESAGRA